MTERSFREPPNRPASSHGPYPLYETEAPPPVPALPKSYAAAPAVPLKSARRPASVEPPERVSSPPPRQSGGRGASLDRGPGKYAGKQKSAKAGLTGLKSVGEVEGGGSRASVNFSRPMSPVNSPPVSPVPGHRVRSPSSHTSQCMDRSSKREADPSTTLGKATKPVLKKEVTNVKEPMTGVPRDAIPLHPPLGDNVKTVTRQNQPSESVSSQAPTQVSNLNETFRPKKKKKKKNILPGNLGDREAGQGFGSSYPSDTDSVTSERSSTTDRPRSFNSRAAGLLVKQPSVVREDREGEENADVRSLVPKTKTRTVQEGMVGSATPANTSKVVSKDRQPVRTPSQQTPPSSNNVVTSLSLPDSTRSASLSPARAAHFSSQPVHDVADTTKHQPPARSVSPAKSALKYSPSRGHSPVIDPRRSLAPSETSDTASAISDDGSRSASKKKKKNVRVSFDEDSVTAGRVKSPVPSTHSHVLPSPQDKSKSRSWLDLVREKKEEQELRAHNQDTSIRPTPTLPSFGSVRGSSDAKFLGNVEPKSPSGDWASNTMQSIDSSSDRAVGSLLFHDATSKLQNVGSHESVLSTRHDPLPPEVTTVEGSGYHSDESEEIRRGTDTGLQIKPDTNSRNHYNALEKTLPQPEAAMNQMVNNGNLALVPSIAFQPATPGVEDGSHSRDEWLGMPGEFPKPGDSKADPASTTTSVEHPSPVITPATMGIAEPETAAVAAQHDQGAPNVGEIAQGLRIQIESQSGDESEDTTGGSIYSDAAEDQSDLEGDGFGSINAIVESPAADQFAKVDSPQSDRSAPKETTEKSTRSDAPAKKASELSEPASGEGWDQAQAYWSGLTQTRRQQLERAAVPGAVDEHIVKNRTMRGADALTKKKKRAPKRSPPTNVNNVPLPTTPKQQQHQTHVERSASPKSSELKSQTRKSAPNSMVEPQMRTSMRAGPPEKSAVKHKAPSAPVQVSSELKGTTLQKKNRPVSAVAMIDYNKPREALSVPNRTRAASAEGPQSSLTPVLAQSNKKVPATASNLRRATSNGSDSSSSFKRVRSSAPESQRYTMKRSMRPSSMDARTLSPAGNRASSLSARTSSPTGSNARRPFSSVGPGGMRTSMRASMESPKPARTSLRSSADSNKANRTKSPSRFGFSKGTKSPPTESRSGSRFSSRFADSSDEEGVIPARNSSRFADSSDEEEPAKLSAVRGIPRRIDEGESTDLEDSSVENSPAPAMETANGLHNAPLTKPEGLALATGSLRSSPGTTGPTISMGSGLQAKKSAEKEKKKRSFFGGLGSKRRDDSSKAQKAGLEGRDQRGTMVEKSKPDGSLDSSTSKPQGRVLGPSSPNADPAPDAASKTQKNTGQSSPKSPKLQRRNTPQKFASASDVSWPLSPSMPGRPRTSDGPAEQNAGTRPGFGTRGSTVQSEGASGSREVLAIGNSEKKKRFPMLRKALRL